MMDIEKLIERYHNLANRWENGEQLLLDGTMRIQDELRDAATALSTLQAENEKLRAELERCKEKNAGLALALLTECAPNPDCLGDDEWRAIRAELEKVTRERDAAVDCIYQIEDDLDRGSDNDWAREHISEWESQKEERRMIDPAICKGCDHWKTVGWHGGANDGQRACHYLLDVGTPSRTRLGQLDVCNVRSVGGNIRPRASMHKYDTRRRPMAGERYMELYKRGLTDRQIAEKAGSTINAVANWRQRKKLQPHKAVKPVYIPEEKTGDPCLRCYSAAVCRKVGGTCNEKERWKDD